MEKRFDLSVSIDPRDLRYFPRPELVWRVIQAAFYGFAGSSFLSTTHDLLWVSIAIAISAPQVLLASYRNRIVKKVAARGFVALFAFRETLRIIFYIAPVFTFAGVAFFVYSMNIHVLYLPLAIGLWLQSISSNFSSMLNPRAVGKLSIGQFVVEFGHGNPNYSWLRRGLQHVEKRLRRLGVACPRSALFLGASYSILKKGSVGQDLNEIGEWVGEPGNQSATAVLATIEGFLNDSRDAEKAGFRAAPTLTDYMGDLPWQNISYAIGSLAVALGLIIALAHFLAVG